MADPLGADTRDILALGRPHPAETGLPDDETETAARRHGRRCRRTGLAVIAGTAVSTLIAFIIAAASEHSPFDDPAAVLFAALGIITAALTGSVLLAVGLHERNQRPQRAMSRLAITRVESNSQRLDRIEAAVASLPERIAALERVIARVPAYGEGVIHGVQLRSDALGLERESQEL